MTLSLFSDRQAEVTLEDSLFGDLEGDADGLRWYQREAVDGIHAQLKTVRSTLIVCATGTGKTTIFGAIAKHWPGSVLILAHRDELVQQARRRIEHMTGEWVEVEQAMQTSHSARIVVGSVQSLCKKQRLERLGADRFSLVIVDECHHTTASSYRKVIDFFDGAKLLGVTATPDRGDKVALGKVFESTAYVFDIEDGIDHGYLVPVRGHHVTMTEIDLDVVKKTAGDLAANQLDEAMLKAAGGVVQKTMELYPERQAIVFMPGIKSAELACARFNEMRPGCAMFIHANTEDDERAQMVRDFQRGVYQYFVNVGIATEGFDAPNVSLVVIARPTLSRALYAQMAGRGTRVEPGCIDYTEGREMAAARRKLIAASKKPDCVILDFAGNSTKHSLVSTVDILGGKYTDDEVKRAKKKIEKEPGTNPREALERSRAELRAIASSMRVKVKAESKAFNPFAVLHMDETAGQKHTQKFGYKAMDPGLRNALLNYGLKEAQLKEMSRYDALRFIAAQRARAKAGLCTFKQLVQLQRFGVTEVNVPFDRAKAAMKYIEAKKWGRGDTVDPKKLDAIIHYRREPGDESL